MVNYQLDLILITLNLIVPITAIYHIDTQVE